MLARNTLPLRRPSSGTQVANWPGWRSGRSGCFSTWSTSRRSRTLTKVSRSVDFNAGSAQSWKYGDSELSDLSRHCNRISRRGYALLQAKTVSEHRLGPASLVSVASQADGMVEEPHGSF